MVHVFPYLHAGQGLVWRSRPLYRAAKGSGTVAHSGIFLGNFRESSGKFLDNFLFLENFLNVSLLFL